MCRYCRYCQVKILGGFVRWFQDVAPPSDGVPGRLILTTAATALRYSCGGSGGPAGPVHLNIQFREPLAPTRAPWNPTALFKGLSAWLASSLPYTLHVRQGGVGGGGGGGVGGVGPPGGAVPDPLLLGLLRPAAAMPPEMLQVGAFFSGDYGNSSLMPRPAGCSRIR